jgi:hypothetical protein
MSGQKLEQGAEPEEDDGRRFLKKAIITLAILEAVVLIPIILYKVLR